MKGEAKKGLTMPSVQLRRCLLLWLLRLRQHAKSLVYGPTKIHSGGWATSQMSGDNDFIPNGYTVGQRNHRPGTQFETIAGCEGQDIRNWKPEEQ